MTVRRRSRWLLPVVLLAACGALGAVLYGQIRQAQSVDGATATSTAGGAVIEPLPPEAEFAMPSQDNYAAIVDRPLFSPTRRPETGTISAPIEPGADVPIKLKGTNITLAARSGLFQLGDNTSSVWVSEGGEIGGWVVKEVHDFGAVLERDGESIELFLQYDDTPPPPPEPVEQPESEPPAEEIPPPDNTTDAGGNTTNQ
jgi:hypothetical protein